MRVLWAVPMVVLLGGCNWLNNITGLAKDSNKAIGAACRQTGRSLEECYMRNPDADKGAIFSGWREMQEYMVKNNLPTLSPPDDVAKSAASAPATASAAAADPLGASAPADDGTARRPGSTEPASKSKKHAATSHRLTNEEAEKEAKHDPEVEAVMSAIRNQATTDKEKKAKPTGEADQNKLLDIIQKLNGNPGSSSSSSSSSGGAGSGSSLGKPAVPASNSSNNSN